MTERRRPRRVRVLERVQFIPAALEETFRFFADAHNLARITPPWLGFRVITPGAIRMEVGTTIDYRIRLLGLPATWRSRISRWEPGVAFVDEQLAGPYRWWHHTHTFRAHDGGTTMTDRVEYAVPGGIVAPIVHALIVRRRLEAIFAHRRTRITELLGGGEDEPATRNAARPGEGQSLDGQQPNPARAGRGAGAHEGGAG